MSYIRSFPLLVLPILIYNLIVLSTSWSAEQAAACSEMLGRNVHPMVCTLQSTVLSLPMNSALVLVEGEAAEQIHWAVTLSDSLLMLALVMLFAELLKSTGIQASSIVNHALSLIVFVLGLVQFLMFGAFATSTFFLITLMAVLDVLAGFIVTISAARRDISVAG